MLSGFLLSQEFQLAGGKLKRSGTFSEPTISVCKQQQPCSFTHGLSAGPHRMVDIRGNYEENKKPIKQIVSKCFEGFVPKV